MDELEKRRWRRTASLAGVTLGGGFATAIVLLALRIPLDRSTLLGLPLGFVLAAIGLPLGWTMIAFGFAQRQEEIDRDHGRSED